MNENIQSSNGELVVKICWSEDLARTKNIKSPNVKHFFVFVCVIVSVTASVMNICFKFDISFSIDDNQVRFSV